jgi:hypothetical protein
MSIKPTRSIAASARQRAQRAVEAEPPGQHVVEHAQPPDQLMLLEDHAGGPAMRAQGAAREQIGAGAVQDPPRAGPHQTVEATQQRRFSGTRRAEQDGEGARREAQACGCERPNAPRIDHRHVAHLNHARSKYASWADDRMTVGLPFRESRRLV